MVIWQKIFQEFVLWVTYYKFQEKKCHFTVNPSNHIEKHIKNRKSNISIIIVQFD